MDAWTDKLSDYLDDELAPGERDEIERHLAECGECRTTLDELRRVVARARSLTPRPPSADLWGGIETRLAGVALPFRARQTRFSFTLPQLAAAAALVAAVSGAATLKIAAPWTSSRPAPQSAAVAGDLPKPAPPMPAEEPQIATVGLADAQYDAAVVDLERAMKHGRGRLDPTTVAAIEQSLQTIDQAIEQARQALAADPANTYLTGHLVETRRRKLELLRRAAALADAN